MKRSSLVARSFGLLIAVLVSAVAMLASPVYLVPPGLHAGDQYRLIFVTSTTTAAMSSDINYYDGIVNDTANATTSLLEPLGASWQAIVSTSTTSAASHIGAFSVPVYLVNGVKVADGSQGLWSTQTTPLGADILIDEHGNTTPSPFTWTGTGPDGSQADPLGEAIATVGCTIINTSAWIDVADQNTSEALPLYGISSILTVPEPGSIGLVLIGAVMLSGWKRTSRRWMSRNS